MAAPAIGVSYRSSTRRRLKEDVGDLDVLEVIVDDYLAMSSLQREHVEDLAKKLPVVAHGLGLSLGAVGQPDGRYLERVAAVLERLNATFYSEHLSFSRIGEAEFPELLPLVRTPEMIEVVAANTRFVQSFLDIPFCLENIAQYFEYPNSSLSEVDFLSAVCAETGVGLLLDVENLYANSINLGLEARSYIDALPPGCVRAVHVAGGAWSGDVFFDDHGHDVPAGTLALLEQTLLAHAPSAVIVERDKNLDGGRAVMEEVRRVRTFVLEKAVAAL